MESATSSKVFPSTPATCANALRKAVHLIVLWPFSFDFVKIISALVVLHLGPINFACFRHLTNAAPSNTSTTLLPLPKEQCLTNRALKSAFFLYSADTFGNQVAPAATFSPFSSLYQLVNSRKSMLPSPLTSHLR